MNKKIIITLTISIFLGGSSLFITHYYFKKNKPLNVVENKEEEKEEKKEEETKEEKEEEITTPWLYTWKGNVCCFLVSLIISAIVACIANYFFDFNRNEKELFIFAIILFFIIFLFIFEVAVSPFVIALKKFGKKSYSQRLPKVYSLFKIIIDVIISIPFVFFVVLIILAKFNCI